MTPLIRPTRFSSLSQAELKRLRAVVMSDPMRRATVLYRAKVNGTSLAFEADRVIESMMPTKDEERIMAAVRRETL